ncbi:hypothetical protein [Xanthomonas graminis]|uniref:hypothetical protein n=1 Tax=Xanthomonas graminis TaxID=3390026 RepID=UPI001112D3E3|nr:hypothetical protein [Xanthomonas translucens]
MRRKKHARLALHHAAERKWSEWVAMTTTPATAKINALMQPACRYRDGHAPTKQYTKHQKQRNLLKNLTLPLGLLKSQPLPAQVPQSKMKRPLYLYPQPGTPAI